MRLSTLKNDWSRPAIRLQPKTAVLEHHTAMPAHDCIPKKRLNSKKKKRHERLSAHVRLRAKKKVSCPRVIELQIHTELIHLQTGNGI